jgi:hypothetical protein
MIRRMKVTLAVSLIVLAVGSVEASSEVNAAKSNRGRTASEILFTRQTTLGQALLEALKRPMPRDVILRVDGPPLRPIPAAPLERPGQPIPRPSCAVGTPWAIPRTIRTSSLGRRLTPCRVVLVKALNTRPQ